MVKLQPTSKAHVLQWLPYAFVVSILILFVTVSIRSYVRTSVNEQLIVVTENLAADMFRNDVPSAPLPSAEVVDVERSIAPFVILYDSNGQPTDGTGKLNDTFPGLPQKITEHARTHSEYRLDWKPQANTRLAIVVRYYQNDQRAGFVLAGKNLRETNNQLSRLYILSAATWAITLVGMLMLTRMTLKK